MITMRLFAEEKRTRHHRNCWHASLQLDVEVILGKWLSAVILYASMLLLTAVNFLFPFLNMGHLGLEASSDWLSRFVVAGVVPARHRNLHIHAHKNQIIAGAVTFAVCLLLWILEWVSGYETATWARVAAYMSVITHFESFSKGLLDFKDAIFYVTLIFFGLFLTARSMESLRWRS